MKVSEQRRLEKELKAGLDALMDIVFSLNELPLTEFASRCGLSYTTVYNYWYGVYKYPQFRSLQKLGRGVGLAVNFTADGEVITQFSLKKFKKMQNPNFKVVG